MQDVWKPSLFASRQDNSIQSSLWNQLRPLCWPHFNCSILLVLISTDIDPKDTTPINFLPQIYISESAFPGIWFRAASVRTSLRKLTLKRDSGTGGPPGQLSMKTPSLRTRKGSVKSPGNAKVQLWKFHNYEPGRDILKSCPRSATSHAFEKFKYGYNN